MTYVAANGQPPPGGCRCRVSWNSSESSESQEQKTLVPKDQDDEIVGIKHYNGSWYMHPCQRTVESMIKKYKPVAPAAYGLDVGILSYEGEWRTALVEVNDGVCLGNYGLDSRHYAGMIAARWLEIFEKGRA